MGAIQANESVGKKTNVFPKGLQFYR